MNKYQRAITEFQRICRQLDAGVSAPSSVELFKIISEELYHPGFDSDLGVKLTIYLLAVKRLDILDSVPEFESFVAKIAPTINRMTDSVDYDSVVKLMFLDPLGNEFETLLLLLKLGYDDNV